MYAECSAVPVSRIFGCIRLRLGTLATTLTNLVYIYLTWYITLINSFVKNTVFILFTMAVLNMLAGRAGDLDEEMEHVHGEFISRSLGFIQ